MNATQLLKWYDEFISLSVGYLRTLLHNIQGDAGYIITADRDKDPMWAMWYTGTSDEEGNPVYVEKRINVIRVNDLNIELVCENQVISGHPQDWDWRQLVNDDAVLLEPTLRSILDNIKYYIE